MQARTKPYREHPLVFRSHPDWLSGSKGSRIYCTETQQQQKPVRSLWSFMYRNKNFRAAWRYEIFLNYFLFQHSLRLFLFFSSCCCSWGLFGGFCHLFYFNVAGSKAVSNASCCLIKDRQWLCWGTGCSCRMLAPRRWQPLSAWDHLPHTETH